MFLKKSVDSGHIHKSQENTLTLRLCCTLHLILLLRVLYLHCLLNVFVFIIDPFALNPYTTLVFFSHQNIYQG